mgnify:CR=1 FL=1
MHPPSHVLLADHVLQTYLSSSITWSTCSKKTLSYWIEGDSIPSSAGGGSGYVPSYQQSLFICLEPGVPNTPTAHPTTGFPTAPSKQPTRRPVEVYTGGGTKVPADVITKGPALPPSTKGTKQPAKTTKGTIDIVVVLPDAPTSSSGGGQKRSVVIYTAPTASGHAAEDTAAHGGSDTTTIALSAGGAVAVAALIAIVLAAAIVVVVVIRKRAHGSNGSHRNRSRTSLAVHDGNGVAMTNVANPTVDGDASGGAVVVGDQLPAFACV